MAMQQCSQPFRQAGNTPQAGVGKDIAVGDRVWWNGCYEGRVLWVNGRSAVVFERNNLAFGGRTVKWRLLLTALTRMDAKQC